MAEDSQSRRERLRFQSNAAQIQLAMTGIVRKVGKLMLDLHTVRPASAHLLAIGLAEEFRAERGKWNNLNAPPALAITWAEIDAGMGGLRILMDQLPELVSLEQPERSRRIAALQSRFNQQLSELNGLEARLLDEETRLRKAAAGLNPG
jgi:hypothetical protein